MLIPFSAFCPACGERVPLQVESELQRTAPPAEFDAMVRRQALQHCKDCGEAA